MREGEKVEGDLQKRGRRRLKKLCVTLKMMRRKKD